MNNYIKKCLIVYISLATILFGMVGVTYAITASDADQYVTRSQYAVDMAYLQNKLDEAEAGLMGNINKYRATNIKFVTHDTPVQKVPNTGYRGGNYDLAYKTFTGTMYPNVYNPGYRGGFLTTYHLHRLYNGNYFLQQNHTYNNTNYNCYNCAIPVENLPGYYLVLSYVLITDKDCGYVYFSLERLDRTVNKKTTAEIQAAYPLKIRLKKDLWDYCSESVPRITTTGLTNKPTIRYFDTNHPNHPLVGFYASNPSVGSSTTTTINQKAYIDDVTGDYIIELDGILPTSDISSSLRFYLSYQDDFVMTRFTPLDNVEYLMSAQSYFVDAASISQSVLSGVPFCVTNGDGTGVDKYWEYEIVDCENGIKYFHARKKPSTESGGFVVAWNYSLPIVY